MKLLDLFCGAGGAGMGYHRAGFEVVGVDIKSQPRYPFEFHQADALEYLAAHWQEFDVIHASPPCQAYSHMTNCLTGYEYPALIADVRTLLRKTGRPHVIENVPGAKKDLENPILLCGKTFGLRVYRHRWFEIMPFLIAPGHEPHRDSTPKAGRGPSPKGFISVAGKIGHTEYCRQAMGIDWMTGKELAQAIPPAYTEWIGKRLMETL